MEADDLLCSRNARPQKALVGRAQWKINQLPSLKRERTSLEGSIGSMVLVRCSQYRAASATPFKEKCKKSEGSRSTRAIEEQPGRLLEKQTSKIGGTIVR